MKKHLWMGLVVLLALSCGKEKEGNIETQEASALESVSEVTASADRRDLVGRTITLPRVQAQDVVGDLAFWIGDPNNAIPAVLGTELRDQGAEGDVSIRKGRFYSIIGTVRLVENVDRNDPTWALVDDREMEAISNARVYIETAEVTAVQ